MLSGICHSQITWCSHSVQQNHTIACLARKIKKKLKILTAYSRKRATIIRKGVLSFEFYHTLLKTVLICHCRFFCVCYSPPLWFGFCCRLTNSTVVQVRKTKEWVATWCVQAAKGRQKGTRIKLVLKKHTPIRVNNMSLITPVTQQASLSYDAIEARRR